MSTDQDVRAAFHTLADHAPSEIDLDALTVRSRPTKPQLRPMLAVCGAVAAVIAAVAGVALVLTPHRHSTPPAAAPPGIPLHRTFTLPGYSTEFTTVTAEYQDVDLSGPAFAVGGTVRVYGPGAFNPATIQHGTPVDVNGHRGYYGKLGHLEPGLLVSGTVVAWPYAADAWALVTLKIPSGPARLTDEVKVAEAVRIGPAALKVPFRLGYLPSGLAPTAAQTEPRSPVNEGVITFNDDKLTVTVNRQGLDDAVPHCSGNDAVAVTVRGHHGCFRDDNGVGDGRRLQLEIPGGWLTVQVPRSHTYSDAVLKRIAASATFAELDQPGTWFDADTALPH